MKTATQFCKSLQLKKLLQKTMKSPTNTSSFLFHERINVSDGYSNTLLIYIQKEQENINSLFKPFDIIKVNDIVKTQRPDGKQPILVLREASVVYTGLDKLIGKPMSYDKYKKSVKFEFIQNYLNSEGSNNIPEYLIKKPANNNFGSYNKTSNYPKNHGPIETMNIEHEIDENFMPISNLNMHSDKWRIKARITAKTQKKKFKNSKGGEGEVFSIELIDVNRTEIRGSFFNSASEKFHDHLIEGNVYSFENGSIRPPTYGAKGDVMIVFEETSNIELLPDDPSIIRFKFVFVPIENLPKLPKNSSTDVLGIVKDIGSLDTINLKTGESKLKRNITIYDNSNASVEITLWGNYAEELFKIGDIYAFKEFRVGEFRSAITLSNNANSKIIRNTKEFPEAENLRIWKDRGIVNMNEIKQISDENGNEFKPIYRIKTLHQIEEEARKSLESTDDKIFNDAIVYIYMIRSENMYYLSCPLDKCNKKVFEDGARFRCESCKRDFPDPNPRYIVSSLLADSSSQIWATFYDKEATMLLGRPAQDFRSLKENGQDSLITEMLKEVQYKEIRVRIKSTLDTYMGENRTRHSIFKIYEGLQVKDLKLCLNELEEYLKAELNIY